MEIRPLNYMVYIEVSAEEKKTPGGLHIVSDESLATYKLAKVLAAVESDNVKVKAGDTVIVPPKISAMEIDKDKRRFLVPWTQIYGIVEKD